jgi:signal transduction histidine kinase
VQRRRLVLALFVLLIVASGALAALGLRSLAVDAQRVDARYREQARGALAAVSAALDSVVDDVRRAREPAIAVRVGADRVCIEPSVRPAARARGGTLASIRREDESAANEHAQSTVEHSVTSISASAQGPRDLVLLRYTSDDIDRMERTGDVASARTRLRELAAREDDAWLAAWALSALAALERRAGDVDAAVADWRAIATRFAGVRDERGLDRALAARYELALAVVPSDEAAPLRAQRFGELLELYADLIDASLADDRAATAALKERVSDQIATEIRASDRALRALEPRFAELVARDRSSELAADVAEACERAIGPWLAEHSEGGAFAVELRRRALDAPRSPERRAIVVLERDVESASTANADARGWRGGALEIERCATLALARPEIATYASLGIATSIASADGRTLAFAGADERSAADERTLATVGSNERVNIRTNDRSPGEALVELRAAPPFDDLKLAAFGLDREGFLARERRRFTLVAALSAVALAVAAIAGFATLRAVRRETDAAQSREAFVAAVTHELKAPLASIRLLAEVLGRGGVEDAKVQEFAARTVRESERLTRLVDSVLEWARIEHGRARTTESVDLNEVAVRARETFVPLARERGFDVELRAAPNAVIVNGDADALAGALLNLLDNALKYADAPHTIEIEVSRTSVDFASKGESNDARGVIAVLDRGRGVPPSEAQRIFEPFRRVGDELVRDRPGVGLGLALVHKIALAHGGRATCAPREGGGSRFAIELPLAPDARHSDTALGERST